MRAVLVPAVALLVALAGCGPAVPDDPATDPVDDPVHAPPGEGPSWHMVAKPPGDVDPQELVLEVREGTVVLSLPSFPPYDVTGVTISDEAVVVATDLKDGTGDRIHLTEEQNLVAIAIEDLADGPYDVHLTGAGGARLDIRLSRSAACAAARDHARTDFDSGPTYSYIGFRSVDGRERLVYGLDFGDSQSIDRRGKNAVAGWFEVDAATGEVVADALRIVPLGSTRQLAAGPRLLGWSGPDLVLFASGDKLLTYDLEGNLVKSLPTELDTSDLAFLCVKDTEAWFEGPEGCVAVDLLTGEKRAGDCPALPDREGELLEEDLAGGDGWIRASRLTLTVAMGEAEIRVVSVEDWREDSGSLEAIITRDGEESEVDVSELEWYVVLHDWAVDTASERVFLSTEIFGPRYGMWVTEYALSELDASTGDLRLVALMPTPRFSLAPGGAHAAYTWGDRILLVTIDH